MLPAIKVTLTVEKLSASGGPTMLIGYKTINTTVEGNSIHICKHNLNLMPVVSIPIVNTKMGAWDLS